MRLALCLAATCLLALLLPSCTDDGPGRPSRDAGPLADGQVAPGVDGGLRCTPGRLACAGNTSFVCGDDGMSRTNEVACDVCAPGLGCVLCVPGSRRCEGTVSMVCATDGRAWLTGRDCSEWGSSCGGNGYCGDACGEAEQTRSNVGCEYWPAPLANPALDGSRFDFRVVVANPNDTAANVRITRNGVDAYTGTVAANGLAEIPLPWIPGQSLDGIQPDDWRSITVAGGAYRMTSDVPVIAMQFNPFEYSSGGANSFTNDATLLYPTHVLTGDYVGLAYYPLSRTVDGNALRYPGYIAVVGVSPEPTRVQVSARGAVAADAAGRFPATPTGGSFVVTLQQGEVVHIAAAIPPECAPGRPGYVENRECESTPIGEICDVMETCREQDYDLTGTRITADRPVAVFGGHACAYVPTSAEACDHLEEQLPPIQSWGRAFVGAPMGDGSIGGTNVLRVIAYEDTTVTVSPPQGGVGGGALRGGEFLELDVTSPFEVTGTSAIMVAQYLRGQYATEPAAQRGDPDVTVLVPSEQYREDYTFVLPSSYNAGTNGQNHLLVVRQPGVALTLDGAAVSATFVTVGGREIAVIPLAGGTHAISSTEPFGLIAYGLGSFTSYSSPAGLNLDPITVLY
ncbi:IgGFc-binding protein [Sandaracinus amylolyticus]|uniref:Hemagglutinin/hemolysin-related protein n=1 Tax=Sandaracinus amylolyticus TaxID=927083 RepID=A0A0F6YLE7_9BACT|nr:IgGFc-binding protein [Sandaracinus amylolyticus]AKF09803.1 Hemagglutinin/hemolysin-related protein [Sandaracinus amylolyticus]